MNNQTLQLLFNYRNAGLKKNFFLFSLLFFFAIPSGYSNPLAILKSFKGKGVVSDSTGKSYAFKNFDKITQNQIVETQETGEAVFRLFLAQGQFTIHPSTQVKFIEHRFQKKKRVSLELSKGLVDLNFSDEAGKLVLMNTQNTTVEALGSRWFASINNEGVTKLVVIKGSLKVYNHPKDMSANVPEGKTCFSDKDGLRIGTSSPEDLESIRQNLIEIDFMDPVSDQTKTLEIEYETNF